MGRRLRTLLCALCCLGAPADSRADWLITPFLGRALGGSTSLIDLENGAEAQHWAIGASGAWLSNGVFGLEGDFSHVPGFFERGARATPVTGSSLMTVTGNVLLAVPSSLTRDSLRPYLTAGVGLLHPRIDSPVFPVDNRLLGLSVGGGAIGFVSRRTGVRFDLRRFQNVRGEGETLVGVERVRLSYWRASVGLILRY